MCIRDRYWVDKNIFSFVRSGSNDGPSSLPRYCLLYTSFPVFKYAPAPVANTIISFTSQWAIVSVEYVQNVVYLTHIPNSLWSISTLTYKQYFIHMEGKLYQNNAIYKHAVHTNPKCLQLKHESFLFLFKTYLKGAHKHLKRCVSMFM